MSRSFGLRPPESSRRLWPLDSYYRAFHVEHLGIACLKQEWGKIEVSLNTSGSGQPGQAPLLS